MDENVEIYYVDKEGILIRASVENELFSFEGELEDLNSPLMLALGKYYYEDAPQCLVCKGFNTPTGTLLWQSELASPASDDTFLDIGERLFLVDIFDERFMDDYTYQILADGRIPSGWSAILNDTQ